MRERASHSRILRFLAPAAVLLAGACGGPSPDKVRSAVVAEAAGGTLTGEALERWLVTYRVAPSRETVNTLVSAWINSSLLIDAVRHQAPLDDSATVQASIAPDAARGMAIQYFAARHVKPPVATDQQADSVADADQVRMYQQIFLRVPRGADSTVVRPIVNRAQSLLQRATSGTAFEQLVQEASQDSATRANGGFVPPMPHDRLPPSLAALWTLSPGQVLSRVVAGPGGFYIFRRASRVEARPQLRAWLVPQFMARSDMAFVDSLMRAHPIQVASDASARLRAMAVEPVVAPDGPAYVTWDGGALTPAMVRTSVMMLSPAERATLTNTSDSGATRFVAELAHREIISKVVMADAAAAANGRQILARQFRQAVDSLRAVVGRLPASLSPTAAASMQIDSSVAGRPQFLPLPGALAGVLRSRATVKVNPAVMDDVLRVAEPAWQIAHRNDTTATRPRPDSTPPQ